jgi:hypothetical protein
MTWGWNPVKESDFAVLYDAGGYWVVEDKTRSDMPIRFQGQTMTIKNIYMDFAEDEKGNWLPVRSYYPKDQFDYKLVLGAFQSLTAKRRREFRKLERLLRAKESELYG